MEQMVLEVEGETANSTYYHLNDGFFFVVHSSDNKRVYLKCIKAKTCKSRASIPLNQEDRTKDSFRLFSSHNHDPDLDLERFIKVRRKILDRCSQEMTTFSEIWKEEIARVDSQLMSKFSNRLKFRSMYSSMYRARIAKRGKPPQASQSDMAVQNTIPRLDETQVGDKDRALVVFEPPDFTAFEVATTDNVEKNVQSSGNLTESSQQPIASTSTSVQPKPVVKKATTAKTSERKKIAGPTDMQVATTATSTNNETALLHEKIRQLEEINIQLQIENESYRIKNVMLETQKNKLIGKLKTIVKAKDPLALGENTLIFEQHSERLTVGPISSASNPGYPTASTATLTGDSQIDDIIGTHSQDYSDADNAGDDDDSSYLDNMGGGGGQIEIDVDVDPAFETVDIKPLIVHGEVQPQPQTTKRKRNSDPLDPSATSSKRSTPLKKKLLCDFGDEGNEDDDDEPDYGDDFDSEEDSAKVRRAYELLKSVFDKKDKYDLFCDRLAGRLRALQSPKVCRHVQQILVTAVADAEAGKFDNI